MPSIQPYRIIFLSVYLNNEQPGECTERLCDVVRRNHTKISTNLISTEAVLILLSSLFQAPFQRLPNHICNCGPILGTQIWWGNEAALEDYMISYRGFTFRDVTRDDRKIVSVTIWVTALQQMCLGGKGVSYLGPIRQDFLHDRSPTVHPSIQILAFNKISHLLESCDSRKDVMHFSRQGYDVVDNGIEPERSHERIQTTLDIHREIGSPGSKTLKILSQRPYRHKKLPRSLHLHLESRLALALSAQLIRNACETAKRTHDTNQR